MMYFPLFKGGEQKLILLIGCLFSVLITVVEMYSEYLDDCKTYGKKTADEIQKHYEELGA